MECALKTARKYHSANGQPERIDVIGFDGAFHGRTYAAVNSRRAIRLTSMASARSLPGYVHLRWGDHEALKAAVASPTAAAIIIEPVQGEGGARALPTQCLRGLRQLCDEYGLLSDLRRDSMRAGAYRQTVRLRMGGRTRRRRRTGHHVSGEGARRRLPGRRLPRHHESGQGHGGRRTWLDLWRQPPGDGRGAHFGGRDRHRGDDGARTSMWRAI